MDVLIDADTIRSPELRHEIPAGVVDPFLYGEHDGVAFAAVSPLDAPTIAAARPDLQQLDMFADLGLRRPDRRAAEPRDDALLEVRLRACREMGVTRAAVPPTFPLATAEHLRAGGIELHVDHELFAARRRNKTAAELRGIWRATNAAEAGLRPQLRLYVRPSLIDGVLHRGRRAADAASASRGRRPRGGREPTARRSATSRSAAARRPRPGTARAPGRSRDGELVIVDLWPQDRESACFSDIARTFVAGDARPGDRARGTRSCSRRTRGRSRACAPGVLRPRPVERGRATSSRPTGSPPSASPARRDGGLPDRARPRRRARGPRGPGARPLGQRAAAPATSITIEPFLCRPGFGAVQVEDILLVTGGRRRGAQLAPDRTSSGRIRVGRCSGAPCGCR